MPVLTRPEAAAFASRLRESGGRLVFTNGCFDLLHPGHVRYLAEARSHGDALIVGVNSDRSVRAIKGPSRPINTEGERAEILAALAVVDAVVIFDEDDPLAIVTELQPDVLAKGADWAADRIVGRDVVEARGGQVIRIALAPGFSSTGMIEKSAAGADPRSMSTSLTLQALLKAVSARLGLGTPGAAHVTGLPPSAQALYLAAAALHQATPSRPGATGSTIVVVVPTDPAAEQLTSDLRFFLAVLEGLSEAAAQDAVLSFPSHEVDPYRGLSPTSASSPRARGPSMPPRLAGPG